MRYLLVIALGLVASLVQAETPSKDNEYLSDIAPGIATFTGMLGIDTTPYRMWPKVIPGAPIRIKDQEYSKGLGIDAPGQIVVSLNGRYDAFDAEVGAQWQGNPVGTVTFKVLVDGQPRFDSGPMQESDPAKTVHLTLQDAKEMRLVTEGSGMCNWANAQLTRSATAATAAGGVDMAPFARVVSYDPSRINGIGVDRLTEVPAEDVFYDTDVAPSSDGSYRVPVANDGQGCLGLQWTEPRRIMEVGLEFPEGTPIPPTTGVRVEYWMGLGLDYVSGESNWQGSWKPMRGAIQQQGNRWVVKSAQETRKIRWIFPAGETPLVVQRLSANTSSQYQSMEAVLELEQPLVGQQGEVEIYNGELLQPSGSRHVCRWDLGSPLRLKLNYTTAQPWALDRTVLRVRLPQGAFAVAIDDLLPNEFPPTPLPKGGANARIRAIDDLVEDLYNLGCVYVKDYGFFAKAVTTPMTLGEYQEKIKGRKTVLEQVRQMPDQTWSQAVEKLYLARQDNSPTMLALAWDNRKVVVDRNGTVHYGPRFLDFVEYKHRFEVTPQFGTCPDVCADASFTRDLDNGWMPIPHIRTSQSGVVYHQRTFVAPSGAKLADSGPIGLYERPIAVAEYTIENTSDTPSPASLKLSFVSDWKTREEAEVQAVAGRVLATKGEQLLAVAEVPEASGLRAEIHDATLTLSGTVPAKSHVRCYVYLPVEWELKAAEQARLADGAELRKAAEQYWRDVMAPAMKIEIPEPQLENLIAASQVHCLNASLNEENGKYVDAYIAATYYGSLDSESHNIIRGMDFLGQHDFARRALEFFVKRQKPAGYFSHGYTLMATGHHLGGLSQHYELTGDAAWWKGVAAGVVKMCDWMSRQSEKTKRLDLNGQKVPEYGLQPPGTAADWQHWGYIFYSQSYYYWGIETAARTLANTQWPDAEKFRQFAQAFRQELQRAFRWTQERTPVVQLRDGTWVPGSPYEVYAPGPVQQFFPNYTIRIYEEILGCHHLAGQGVLDPHERSVGWMMDALEDLYDLRETEWPAPANYAEGKKTDPFHWGGVSKSQPYYMRNLEAYAARDEVKPFIRAYFNTAASEFNREDLAFWEGMWGISVWNKTAETGEFLYQSRLMFVMEKEDQLWLAPFVPNQWLQDGQTVAIQQAPTYFGPVGYRITSHVAQGYLEATIDPPSRKSPSEIVLRLRHPEGKAIRKVLVNGVAHSDFDPAREIVRLKPSSEPIHVRAEY